MNTAPAWTRSRTQYEKRRKKYPNMVSWERREHLMSTREYRWGGCGAFALALIDYWKSGRPYLIVNRGRPSHVVVKHQGKFYDSSGCIVDIRLMLDGGVLKASSRGQVAAMLKGERNFGSREQYAKALKYLRSGGIRTITGSRYLVDDRPLALQRSV